MEPPRNARQGRFILQVPLLLLAVAALILTGCSTGAGPASQAVRRALQTVQYHPYEVKGYQKTYPLKHILVLMPVDARKHDAHGETNVSPQDGGSVIGKVVDQSGKTTEQLDGPPLAQLVQGALIKSADEAGMVAQASSQSAYRRRRVKGADYVIASKLDRCWVVKHLKPPAEFGSSWVSIADVKLDVTIYKPPFSVPFWRAISSQEYSDPPVDHSVNSAPPGETAIYRRPGEVLSVALTRAVAAIFSRPDLQMLIAQDAKVRH